MFSPDEYRALTEGAGLVRRGDRGVLVVTGADRLSWLQGLLTNDVVALPPGGICDAAYLTPQGRMITSLRVFNDDARTLLDVPASLAESLQRRLDGLLFSEDAQIVDASNTIVVVDVHGPRAEHVLSGESAVRDDTYELPGFSAFVPAADVEGFITRVCERGAMPVTLETLDVVRVEAGTPAFLIDMDEHTIPLEAGLERSAISFTKGCYVGQEVIVRVTQRGGGRVAKKLVGVKFDSNAVPKSGDEIWSSGKPMGRLTSVARSPVLGTSIALAYVHRDLSEAGTKLSVRTTSGEVTAEVSPLPFIPLALLLHSSAV
jgi:folate-binding protein YgfZ